jgi:feruloyl esterase
MGAGSLSEVFTTPPKVLPPGPQAAFDYLLDYDFDRDAPAIYATSAEFPRSAWDDINARSPDLDAFRKHGGKLLVYQGASDGVFSVNDTISWWTEADARMDGHADETARLFPVPGMGHCAGGPATDHFDGFGALIRWVEQGQAPERIEASAGPGTPWRGRTRPLCAYPAIARYSGKGDIERSENFVCIKPSPAK